MDVIWAGVLGDLRAKMYEWDGQAAREGANLELWKVSPVGGPCRPLKSGGVETQ